jgi:hypothetical protein
VTEWKWIRIDKEFLSICGGEKCCSISSSLFKEPSFFSGFKNLDDFEPFVYDLGLDQL